MTKTYTEQYKFGEIKTGYFWCKIWGEDALVIKWLTGDNEIHQSNLIEEVLAPVPSYDEYKQLVSKTRQLEKKLEIATKALKDYANSDEWELVDSKNVYWSRKRFPYPWRIAGKALKEMEGVK